ncbi:MAG: GOLPH3/VPS74 family protein [Stackebrandtia sp.]
MPPKDNPAHDDKGAHSVLLADECWLVAHNDTTGASLLPPRLAGLAAAAGLLCEMVYSGRLAVVNKHLSIRDRAPSPDLLQHTITDHLVREKHPIETWLRFFARTAEDDLAARLIRNGILDEQQSRGLFGRKKRRYIPKVSTDAAWPTARIAKRLAQARPVDAVDQILIAWIDAVGLTGHVLWDDPKQVGARYLTHVVAHLPGEYRTILDDTKHLVGQIIMTHQA